MSIRAVVLCAVLLVFPIVITAGQWPQFRGPSAGIAADDRMLPEKWSDTENVAWSLFIPGQGWSSPIIWDDHVFVTTAISSGQGG